MANLQAFLVGECAYRKLADDRDKGHNCASARGERRSSDMHLIRGRGEALTMRQASKHGGATPGDRIPAGRA
jgi:hypothetical protein